MQQPFDALAKSYDTWYDTSKGRQIFDAELKCLRCVCPACEGRWLEVGAGTGRFAERMGIKEGIDPSPAMLELAALRGITTYAGYAEALPFDADAFDGILMALAICFIKCPEKAFFESYRVLKSKGLLLVGFVPAESPWGKLYQEKKKQGHSIYRHARFLTTEAIMRMAEKNGFSLPKSACSLFGEHCEVSERAFAVQAGISEQAGFTALLFFKAS